MKRKLYKKNCSDNKSEVIAYASEGYTNRNCYLSCYVVNIGCLNVNCIC